MFYNNITIRQWNVSMCLITMKWGDSLPDYFFPFVLSSSPSHSPTVYCNFRLEEWSYVMAILTSVWLVCRTSRWWCWPWSTQPLWLLWIFYCFPWLKRENMFLERWVRVIAVDRITNVWLVFNGWLFRWPSINWLVYCFLLLFNSAALAQEDFPPEEIKQ